MQITFTGTMEELIRFADQIRGPQPTAEKTTADDRTTKSAKKTTEKTEKPAEVVTEKAGEKPVEKTEVPAQGTTETPMPPMPPASNTALAILKTSLAALIREKGNAAVAALLGKYGAEKVSQVKPEDVETITAEAKALAAS